MSLSYYREREPRQRCRGCGNTMPLVSLVAALFLALCFTPSPASAAIVMSNDASTRSLPVAPHLGDLVPMTVYLRLKRQILSTFISLGVDRQLAVDEGANDDDLDAEILQPNDLQLFQGTSQGKHAHQLVRLLPPGSSPRFGINKAVTINANNSLRVAGKSLEQDKTLQQSDLALRFSVGSGLARESTWLPLAARIKYMSELHAILSGHPEAMRAVSTANAAAKLERVEMARGMAATGMQTVQYLSRISFYMGYRTGDVQKMTSLSTAVHYAPTMSPEIELQFIWSEDSPYNPNRAVTMCSIVVLVASMITAMAVLHPSSQVMRLFTQRIVALRTHE